MVAGGEFPACSILKRVPKKFKKSALMEKSLKFSIFMRGAQNWWCISNFFRGKKGAALLFIMGVKTLVLLLFTSIHKEGYFIATNKKYAL